jgi:hypothetical protein
MGINNDWSFEKHILSINGDVKINAYDHTISEAIFKKKIKISLKKILRGKLRLKEILLRIIVWQSYKQFFTENIKHFQERVCSKKDTNYDVDIQDIFQRIASDRILIKMDIEGDEYQLIDDIIAYSDRIVGMIIEFHETGLRRFEFNEAIKKIQNVFEIVHFHANNYGLISKDGLPNVLEMTFIKKQGEPSKNKRTILPIKGLDCPNNPIKKL